MDISDPTSEVTVRQVGVVPPLRRRGPKPLPRISAQHKPPLLPPKPGTIKTSTPSTSTSTSSTSSTSTSTTKYTSSSTSTSPSSTTIKYTSSSSPPLPSSSPPLPSSSPPLPSSSPPSSTTLKKPSQLPSPPTTKISQLSSSSTSTTTIQQSLPSQSPPPLPSKPPTISLSEPPAPARPVKPVSLSFKRVSDPPPALKPRRKVEPGGEKPGGDDGTRDGDKKHVTGDVETEEVRVEAQRQVKLSSNKDGRVEDGRRWKREVKGEGEEKRGRENGREKNIKEQIKVKVSVSSGYEDVDVTCDEEQEIGEAYEPIKTPAEPVSSPENLYSVVNKPRKPRNKQPPAPADTSARSSQSSVGSPRVGASPVEVIPPPVPKKTKAAKYDIDEVPPRPSVLGKALRILRGPSSDESVLSSGHVINLQVINFPNRFERPRGERSGPRHFTSPSAQ